MTDSETQEAVEKDEMQEDVEKETAEKDIDSITEKTLCNHIVGSMGVGLIPLPVVDLVALTGIQMNLLRKLANTYDIPFSKNVVKSIVGSLIGGGVPVAFSAALASAIKVIPIIGHTTSALTMPVLAGATTYAVGKVFIKHFATGGTFLDFDPDKVRDYYYEMFKEGQNVATEMKNNGDEVVEGREQA